MSDPASKKAEELIAKADKKLASWFASFTGSKYEDAEEVQQPPHRVRTASA